MKGRKTEHKGAGNFEMKSYVHWELPFAKKQTTPTEVWLGKTSLQVTQLAPFQPKSATNPATLGLNAFYVDDL